ncbi:MAG: hypothetical protein AUH05_01500 [Ktedonobacter sp. 13_2_20CM_53_11]|nr:MAG: hypothetical protein AUH05_01500 [Ktedonobacter sp. 13_2_20CM_53_11]
MSRKPEKTPEQDKQKRKRKKKTKQTITRAVTPIRLIEANVGKLAALDKLMAVYLPLCQQYVTWFSRAERVPDRYTDPVFESDLSERLHRVAIQQAAGIAKSFRTNRQAAYDASLENLADYTAAKAQALASGKPLDMERKEPEWHEWNLPELRVPCIQANANVVVVEKSEDTTFDYWLRISTLDKGNPLRVPVKLASYHKQALEGRTLNGSTTLHKRNGVWWLTLSFDEDVPLQTATSAPCVGVDVGIANFITTSTGKQYGTFHGKLARRQKRDREKRRRKAKLRACLKKKGVENLPSTSSATGQRLSRHVRQEINRAVNLLLEEHQDARIIYEDLWRISLSNLLGRLPNAEGPRTRSRLLTPRRSVLVAISLTARIEPISRRSAVGSVATAITLITMPRSISRVAIEMQNCRPARRKSRSKHSCCDDMRCGSRYTGSP